MARNEEHDGTLRSLSFLITPGDYGEYSLFAQQRTLRQSPGIFLRMFAALVFGLVVVLIGLFIVASQESDAPVIAAGDYTELAVAGVLLALVLLAIFVGLIPALKLQKKMAAAYISDGGPMTGDMTLNMSEEGLVVTGAHMQSIFHWSAFRCVLEHKKSVYLMIDNGAGVIVPRTAFDSKADRLRFMADAADLMERAKAGA